MTWKSAWYASNRKKYKVMYAARLERSKTSRRKNTKWKYRHIEHDVLLKITKSNVQTLNALTYSWRRGWGGDLAARMLTSAGVPLYLMQQWRTWGRGFRRALPLSIHFIFHLHQHFVFYLQKWNIKEETHLFVTSTTRRDIGWWTKPQLTYVHLNKQGVTLPFLLN